LSLTARTIEGVVYGIVGTALVSGLLGWAGYALAGVPKAFTLGLLTFLGAFVPFGTALVWGPAAFWLLQQGEMPWAIFMLVWGALVISSADNVIKPMLISRGSAMPFVLTLVGAVGGVIAFGVIGVFLGHYIDGLGLVSCDAVDGSRLADAESASHCFKPETQR